MFYYQIFLICLVTVQNWEKVHIMVFVDLSMSSQSKVLLIFYLEAINNLRYVGFGGLRVGVNQDTGVIQIIKSPGRTYVIGGGTVTPLDIMYMKYLHISYISFQHMDIRDQEIPTFWCGQLRKKAQGYQYVHKIYFRIDYILTLFVKGFPDPYIREGVG